MILMLLIWSFDELCMWIWMRLWSYRQEKEVSKRRRSESSQGHSSSHLGGFDRWMGGAGTHLFFLARWSCYSVISLQIFRLVPSHCVGYGFHEWSLYHRLCDRFRVRCSMEVDKADVYAHLYMYIYIANGKCVIVWKTPKVAFKTEISSHICTGCVLPKSSWNLLQLFVIYGLQSRQVIAVDSRLCLTPKGNRFPICIFWKVEPVFGSGHGSLQRLSCQNMWQRTVVPF